MTHDAQRRWLLQEQRACEHLLSETMVIGATILEKARADLLAINALLVTLEEVSLPLFPTRHCCCLGG